MYLHYDAVLGHFMHAMGSKGDSQNSISKKVSKLLGREFHILRLKNGDEMRAVLKEIEAKKTAISTNRGI